MPEVETDGPEEFWKGMHSLPHKYDLLRHPFYEAWGRGELTLYDLREYASEFYHHVTLCPVYLREFAARLPDGGLRTSVLDKLRSELGMSSSDGRAQNLLWLDFAVGTGALPSDVLTRRPITEINALVEVFLVIARKGKPVEALAAFYVYESQQARVAKETVRELRTIYGLDEGACKYFTLYASGDSSPALVWCEQLQELVQRDSKGAQQAMIAGERTAKALWQALDGVNARRTLKSVRSQSDFN